ncbi:1D-myo-inositol 2-acetamido-2-deoxy-alpha-D-glucopyranoside deacetylase [Corynebacterium phocae]|uniref:1D-myo-inositol 2-acetamido-2-deoxy-alpha-D-glucopyranoside deacetylase n=1 Tax=Corynebacterium phocae TaxID=161895 RepID=A0A1L7D3T1_9CORY|nr:PIG-L family deacetylase [Corynebacterium phocae]APT92826.1 1D-myo-inositol 2-acetamido-2-deoxy-alpha-D-glucopyranoside deacetylase [Corynebacterium phocae]KAA8723143.1 N-acetyl-1-D-myo-inositol-2-amino-2-deoxy-alpha-D-glucopyranoside deacetylase [Corynebacterium phocae]
MPDLNGYRVVAVHAHPDDEALFTGGTLADMARRGAEVTVITLTLGDEGEVIGGTYGNLVPAGLLGGLRARELEDSARALGVAVEMLGGAGFFRDSGMVGSPAHDDPRALVNRQDEAARLLRTRLACLRPHIVLTYGPDGGYGHPDHVAAHRITHAAAAPEQRVWWAIFDRESHRAGLEAVMAPRGWQKPDEAYFANFTTAGAAVTYPLDDASLAAKKAAMAAHPTQIWLADATVSVTNPRAAVAGVTDPGVVAGAYALSNLLVMPLLRAEHYQAGANCPPQATGLLDGLRP